MKDKAHLPRIQKETGLPFSEMLFFDDEHKNVERVGRSRSAASGPHECLDRDPRRNGGRLMSHEQSPPLDPSSPCRAGVAPGRRVHPC